MLLAVKEDNTTYGIYYVYLGIHTIICFMHNICSIYRDACMKNMVIYVCLCMIMAICCIHFYWVIVCSAVFDMYIECMWIVTVSVKSSNCLNPISPS